MKKMLFVMGFLLFAMGLFSAYAETNFGIQDAWDNPEANMAAGSSKPGFAQLTWAPGAILPVKLRNGMVTMINLPQGEAIDDVIIGNNGLFDFDPQKGARTMFISPMASNQGSDTNMIVTGKSGNRYIFYLRSEPANSSEITYSQVDITTDGRSAPMIAAGNGNGAGMHSMFTSKKQSGSSSTIGVDGEDYGWIKTMKIDPSEFRFDLDIFVPNPDDYVIAPERVWRDRIFTYIDFGDKVIAMTQRPVVSILIEGGESPVGFRTDGENGRLLIVEAVGDMVLRSGQRVVCIKRREKPFLIADTASVMALAEANVARSMMSAQSFNNVAYNGMPMMDQSGMMMQPTMANGMQMQMMPAAPTPQGSGARGVHLLPAERTTAGAFLPQTGIPLIPSNQKGVAAELMSDTSVKALNDYWTNLLAKFSGEDGRGLLTPYRNKVYFAVDEHGVGELGGGSASARLYRLRVGPLADVDEAQKLCDQLTKFNGTACSVVRVQ